MAVKWFAFIPFWLCVGLLLWKESLPQKKAGKRVATSSNGPRRTQKNYATIFAGLLLCGVVYFSAFSMCLNLTHPKYAPELSSGHTSEYSWVDLLTLQSKMFAAQSNFVRVHPYSSKWYSWPFTTKIFWYRALPGSG